MRTLGGKATLTAIFVVVALLALNAVAPLATVGAHANQVQSSPVANSRLDAAPDRVTVLFTEPIEADFSEIKVLNRDGRQVDNGDFEVDPTEPRAIFASLPPLESGAYVVSWSNVSQIDGHRVSGAFSFAVGDFEPDPVAPAETPLLQSLADPWTRGLSLIGFMLLFGVLFFETAIMRAVRPAQTARIAKIARRALALGLILLLAIRIFALFDRAAAIAQRNLFALDLDTLANLLQNQWGQVWLAQVALLLVALALVLGAPAFKARVNRGALGALLLILSLAALMLNSFVSHAGGLDVQIRRVALANDIVHITAAAVWIGGICGVTLYGAVELKRRGSAATAGLLKALLPRFTPPALTAALVVVCSGMLSSLLQVGGVAAFASPYGAALLFKIATVAVLILVALINVFFVAPRLRRSARPRRFVSGVALEMALTIAIVAAAGWLTALEPATQYEARVAAERGMVVNQTAEQGINATTVIAPGGVGANEIIVTLTDANGAPPAAITDVRARVSSLAQPLNEPSLSLTQTAPGEWTRADLNIVLSGSYQAEVQITRAAGGGLDSSIAFQFDTDAAFGSSVPSQDLIDAAWLIFGGYIALAAALLLILGAYRGAGFRLTRYQTNAFGALALIVGLLLFFNVFTARVGLLEDASNPFPPDTESVALGQAAYATHCAMCHGDAGRGDGALAPTLAYPPSDLTIHAPYHLDADLLNIINQGIIERGMPAFEGMIDADDQWHLINYLRTLPN